MNLKGDCQRYDESCPPCDQNKLINADLKRNLIGFSILAILYQIPIFVISLFTFDMFTFAIF